MNQTGDPAVPATTTAPETPKLKRVLKLWDLVYYGIILTSPIAVVPMFGEAQVLSRGHAVVTLLAAMVAMTATAVSFGRMATVYPSAGSVYTYVSRAFNPQVGFVLGWAMFLEYLFQPLQNSLYAALTIQRFVPHIPFAVLSALAVGFMTVLCWFGIRTTARANEILLALMSLVMIAFLGEAIWYIFAHQHLQGFISTLPLYDQKTFSVRAIAAGTALAATTYIGFDGVSILAEEVENPKRNVMLASVLVCVFTGLFAAFQVFLAVRVWPDYSTLANPETAFMDVARVVGGSPLFIGFGVVLLISSLACGLAGVLGAVRLLYGMGRDNILPRKIFGHLNPVRGNPTYNVAIVGVAAYIGTLSMQWERSIEILNFGALMAFMAVNLAALKHFGFDAATADNRNILFDIVIPALGFLFCLIIFLGLQGSTLWAGAAWVAAGVVYIVVKARELGKPVMIDFSES
ncbi:MAG TPA: APC family permease [Candidatus Sulfotelmatobacter sp.]|nr:APC family permease [Candidatus Sulfotelmatobacter sp.]